MVPCSPTTAVKRSHVVHKHHRRVVHHVAPVTPVNPSGVVAPTPVVHRKHHHRKPATPLKNRVVQQKMCPSVRTLAMGTPSAIVPEWTKALDAPPVEMLPAPEGPMFANLTSPPVSSPLLTAPSSGHGILGVAAVPAIFLLFLHNHGGGSTEGAQPSPPTGGTPTPPVTPRDCS